MQNACHSGTESALCRFESLLDTGSLSQIPEYGCDARYAAGKPHEMRFGKEGRSQREKIDRYFIDI
jgi:hypothetical protein